MTREEIKNTPEIVDFMLDKSVIADSRMKLHKRLEEICELAIKTLEQEPCEDVISRDEVFKQINCWIGSGEYRYTNATDYLTRRMQGIPPVTPQPKMGHWIEKDGFDGDTYYDCSECGESWTTIDGTPWNNGMKYCPNCGCSMVEPQESEG